MWKEYRPTKGSACCRCCIARFNFLPVLKNQAVWRIRKYSSLFEVDSLQVASHSSVARNFGISNCIRLSPVPVRIGLLQELWKRKRKPPKEAWEKLMFSCVFFLVCWRKRVSALRKRPPFSLKGAHRGKITRIKLERQNSLISFDQRITLVLSCTWFAFLPIHSSETEILALSGTVCTVPMCFCQFILRKLKYLPSPVLYVLLRSVFANSFFGNWNTCLLRDCMYCSYVFLPIHSSETEILAFSGTVCIVAKFFCQFILRKLKYLPSPVLYVLFLCVFCQFILRKLKYLPSPGLYVLFLCVFANSFFGNWNTCLSPVLFVLLRSFFANSFFRNWNTCLLRYCMYCSYVFLPIHSSETEILAFSGTVCTVPMCFCQFILRKLKYLPSPVTVCTVPMCFCQFILRKLKYLPSPVLFVLLRCFFANSFFGNWNTCLLRYCMYGFYVFLPIHSSETEILAFSGTVCTVPMCFLPIHSSETEILAFSGTVCIVAKFFCQFILQKLKLITYLQKNNCPRWGRSNNFFLRAFKGNSRWGRSTCRNSNLWKSLSQRLQVKQAFKVCRNIRSWAKRVSTVHSPASSRASSPASPILRGPR